MSAAHLLMRREFIFHSRRRKILKSLRGRKIGGWFDRSVDLTSDGGRREDELMDVQGGRERKVVREKMKIS